MPVIYSPVSRLEREHISLILEYVRWDRSLAQPNQGTDWLGDLITPPPALQTSPSQRFFHIVHKLIREVKVLLSFDHEARHQDPISPQPPTMTLHSGVSFVNEPQNKQASPITLSVKSY
jgi:hypothetical protein